MIKRLKKWTAAKLRKIARRLDKSPYAEETKHGWTIHTPEGIPLANISTGREA